MKAGHGQLSLVDCAYIHISLMKALKLHTAQVPSSHMSTLKKRCVFFVAIFNLPAYYVCSHGTLVTLQCEQYSTKKYDHDLIRDSDSGVIVFSDQSTQISNPKANKTVKHNQAETDKLSDFIAVMYIQTVQ